MVWCSSNAWNISRCPRGASVVPRLATVQPIASILSSSRNCWHTPVTWREAWPRTQMNPVPVAPVCSENLILTAVGVPPDITRTSARPSPDRHTGWCRRQSVLTGFLLDPLTSVTCAQHERPLCLRGEPRHHLQICLFCSQMPLEVHAGGLWARGPTWHQALVQPSWSPCVTVRAETDARVARCRPLTGLAGPFCSSLHKEADSGPVALLLWDTFRLLIGIVFSSERPLFHLLFTQLNINLAITETLKKPWFLVTF